MFPPPQFGKAQPWAYDEKETILSVLGILISPSHWTRCPPFHLLFSLKSDNTEGVCFPFLLVVEQICDGTALMRSY